MKKALKSVDIKKQQKHSEDLLRSVETMISLRWSSSDWSDRFAEFRSENELREG